MLAILLLQFVVPLMNMYGNLLEQEDTKSALLMNDFNSKKLAKCGSFVDITGPKSTPQAKF